MKSTENQCKDFTIANFADLVENHNFIDQNLFIENEVKRGLRDISGRGVVVGLTRIGEVHGFFMDENQLIPAQGRLRYRGYDIRDLVSGITREKRAGYEETAYLLISGELPGPKDLDRFQQVLGERRQLPETFTRDVILRIPGKNIMNTMTRSVLALYEFDEKPESTLIPDVLNQCISLIGAFPSLAVYAYLAYMHYHGKQSLHIHAPQANMGTAESLLHMLRPDSCYTEQEVLTLDLALILHAEHGGGNNSSFITHVITSSGTDTYSAVAAALGSLKGPKHGGANTKVTSMMDELKCSVQDWQDNDEIEAYLTRILNRNAFDRSGIIYGMGHAVYSLSDPRTLILEDYVGPLAKEKGLEDEFCLYRLAARLAPQVIARNRRVYKGVCANVDFYSGFLYRLLGIPQDLFIPLFAIARIAGWSAHRLEELASSSKIIRPAYKNVCPNRPYLSIKERSNNG